MRLLTALFRLIRLATMARVKPEASDPNSWACGIVAVLLGLSAVVIVSVAGSAATVLLV